MLTEGDVVRSLGSAERSIKEAESALEHLREKGDQEDKTLQEKIDNLREEKTKLEQTLHLKNQLLVANKQETGALKREIEEVIFPIVYMHGLNVREYCCVRPSE